MNVFVLEFKTNMFNNINVTNAANPTFCQTSNPGLVEQKPGLEQFFLLFSPMNLSIFVKTAGMREGFVAH